MPDTEHLAYKVPEAAAACRFSVAKAWVEIKEGRLRAVRAGGRTLVLRKDLEAYLSALEPVAA